MNLLPKPKKNHRKGWTTSLLCQQHVYCYIERKIRQWDICGKRLQEAIRQETGFLLRLSVGETRDGVFSLRLQRHYQNRHMKSQSRERRTDLRW